MTVDALYALTRTTPFRCVESVLWRASEVARLCSLLVPSKAAAKIAMRLDEDERDAAVARQDGMLLVGTHQQNTTAQRPARSTLHPHVAIKRDNELEGVVGMQRRLGTIAHKDSGGPGRPGYFPFAHVQGRYLSTNFPMDPCEQTRPHRDMRSAFPKDTPQRPFNRRRAPGGSAVEGVFLNPVEAAAHQQELAVVKPLQLHVNAVAVHIAIKAQLLRGRPLE